MLLRCFFGRGVRIVHVKVVVSVISHEHQRVLPCPGIGVCGIIQRFIDHDLGFIGSRNGETSYRNIGQIACLQGSSFAVIQQSKEAVVNETLNGIE